MGTQRWWQVRRRMRQARLDRVLDDWQRDFERSRTERFARLPTPTLATYLHAVAMWGDDADEVLLALGHRGDADIDALHLVAVRSGLVTHADTRTTPTTTLTARGWAVLTALDAPLEASVRPSREDPRDD